MAQVWFRHLAHACRDIAKTRRFYEQVLGFTLVEARESSNAALGKLLRMDPPAHLDLVFLKKDGLVLELLGFRPHPTTPRQDFNVYQEGLDYLSLGVEDVSAILAAVSKYGGTVLEDTVSGRSACVKDPDGQVIELVGR